MSENNLLLLSNFRLGFYAVVWNIQRTKKSCLKINWFLSYAFQVEIYEDKDSARKDEIAALGGQTASGTNVFSAFYDRLKEVTMLLTYCIVSLLFLFFGFNLLLLF